MPIKLNINVTKINKDRIFTGKNGKYLGLVLFNKPDQYGNDGFVKEDVSKEDRENGIDGNIIGNWKDTSKKPVAPPPTEREPGQDDPLPF